MSEFEYRVVETLAGGGQERIAVRSLADAKKKVADWTADDVADGNPAPVFRVQRRLLTDWEDVPE